MGIVVLSYVFFYAGFAIMTVSYIWIVILAFHESTRWGLLCFFLPPAQLVFIFQSWDECKIPFFIYLAGDLCSFVIPMLLRS